jgi:hypothetical protein
MLPSLKTGLVLDSALIMMFDNHRSLENFRVNLKTCNIPCVKIEELKIVTIQICTKPVWYSNGTKAE